MTELFSAFVGKHLSVSEGFDQGLRQRFPEVNLEQQYRFMDAFLEANPRSRPRIMARFVVNWLIKEARNRPRIAREVSIGRAPRPEEHGVYLKRKGEAE